MKSVLSPVQVWDPALPQPHNHAIGPFKSEVMKFLQIDSWIDMISGCEYNYSLCQGCKVLTTSL
jgi:hypothetical protein